jgi:hypothetical protein
MSKTRWADRVVRHSLQLLPEEWVHLQRLAEQHGTCPPTGPTAGRPSWRSLIKELARGRFALVPVDDPAGE